MYPLKVPAEEHLAERFGRDNSVHVGRVVYQSTGPGRELDPTQLIYLSIRRPIAANSAALRWSLLTS